MINQEKLNNLYELVIENNVITTKQLTEVGFSSCDITNLINEEALKREKIDSYLFVDDKNLFKYGNILISLRKYDKAEKCFERCYKINPFSYENNFQLFMRMVTHKNYDNAFKYLDNFLNNSFYKSDIYFYLYLLSFVTDIPDKYKFYINKLTLSSIKISKSDDRYKRPKLHNQLRQAVLNQRFWYAYKILGEILKCEKNNQEIEMIRILLHQVTKKQKEINNKLITLLKYQDYESIIKIIEDIEKFHNLNMIDEYILMLAKELEKINKTKVIPKIADGKSENVFDAIYNHDYVLALELSRKYNLKNGIDEEQNIIYCFLKEIVCLISKTQENGKYNVEQNILKAMRLINSGISQEEVYILLDLKEYEVKIIEQFIKEDKKLIKNK